MLSTRTVKVRIIFNKNFDPQGQAFDSKSNEICLLSFYSDLILFNHLNNCSINLSTSDASVIFASENYRMQKIN